MMQKNGWLLDKAFLMSTPLCCRVEGHAAGFDYEPMTIVKGALETSFLNAPRLSKRHGICRTNGTVDDSKLEIFMWEFLRIRCKELEHSDGLLGDVYQISSCENVSGNLQLSLRFRKRRQELLSKLQKLCAE